MNIVTPSHSREVDGSSWVHRCRHGPISTTTTTANESTNTTHNPYLDALWLEGRTLTTTDWGELLSEKVGNIDFLSFHNTVERARTPLPLTFSCNVVAVSFFGTTS
jgi:hypothetical protein